jgi:drug/metabolite transporter (DMT)-like permease
LSEKKDISLNHIIQLCLLGVVWGSSFILIKKGLIGLNATQVGTLRVSFSFLAFLPIVYYYRKEIEWGKWYKYALVGLTTSGIPSLCFSIAQTKVSSAVAGILNSLTPVITLLISVWFFNQKFVRAKLVGVLIGFLGGTMLIFNSRDANNGHISWYALLIVLATICYGFNGNIIKQFFPKSKPIVITAAAFFTLGLPYFVYNIFQEDWSTLISTSSSLTSLGYVALLALFCTVLANIYFVDLVQKTSAVFASTVTFIIPLVAVAWGLTDGEQVSLYHLIALVCVFLSMIMLRGK